MGWETFVDRNWEEAIGSLGPALRTDDGKSFLFNRRGGKRNPEGNS